jgi:hypothetical protein
MQAFHTIQHGYKNAEQNAPQQEDVKGFSGFCIVFEDDSM